MARAFPARGVVVLGALVLSVSSGHAALRLWTGSGPNAFWSTSANWNPAGAPQNGDDLAFVAGMLRQTNTNDLSGRSFHSLIFNGTSSSYTLFGNAVTLSAGVNSLQSPGLASVNFSVTLTGDQEFIADGSQFNVSGDVALNGHTLTLRATSSNAMVSVIGAITGTGDVVKVGVGQALFGGPNGNNYQGTLYVTEGILSLGKGNGGNGLAVPGDLVIGDLDNFIFGKVVLLRPHMIQDTATITINHGTLDLNGWDEYVGPLDMYDGGIRTGTATLIPLAKISAPSWPYVRYPFISGHVYLQTDITFDTHAPGGFFLDASVSGTGGIIKEGFAVLSINDTNDFTGAVTVNNGMLEVYKSPFALGNGPGVTLNGFGILGLREVAVLNKPLTLTSRNAGMVAVYQPCTWSGPINLDFTGMATVTCGDPFNFARLRLTGPIQGTGGLWFGGKDIELNGNNTFSGGVRSACTLLSLNTGAFHPFNGSLEVGGIFYYLDNYYGDFSEPGTNDLCEVRWLGSSFQFMPTAKLHDNGLANLNGHDQECGSIEFNGGRIATGSGKLYVDTLVTANPAASTATIDGFLQLSTFPYVTFNIGDGVVTPDLAINAVVSDGVPSGIYKLGLGEMRLSAANTYRQLTTVGAGVLHIQNNTSLGTTAGTTVLDGGTLQVEFVGALAEPLTIGGAGRGGTNGALNLLPATGVQSGIVLSTNATVRVDSSFAILSGVISGPGGLTKTGAGTLQLGGSSGANNTYAGDTVVARGVLVPFKGAGVTTIPGHLIIGTGAINSPATVRYFSGFTTIGSVTVNRGGLWDLNGQAEGWGVADLQGRPPLTLVEGGRVQTGAGIFYLPVGGDVVVDPGVTSASSSITGHIGLDPGPHRFIVGSGIALTIGGGFPLEVPADIGQTSTAADLVKEGFGTMRLAAANTFTGTVTVNSGTLVISNNAALGSKTAGTFVNNGGSLALEGGLFVQEETLTLNSTNSGALTSLGAVSNTWVAPITLQRTAGINVPGSGGILNIMSFFDCCGGSFISGPGGLTKTGAGKLLLGGFFGSGYDGPTTVSGGTLEAARFQGGSVRGNVVVDGIGSVLNTLKLNAFATASQLSSTGRITVLNGGAWNLGLNNVETIAGLLGDGRVDLGRVVFATNGDLTVNNTVSCEFSGTLNGSGALNKLGTATLYLSGNSPSFTGPTTVFDGTYKVDGKIPNSPVTVKTSSQLRGDGVVGNLTAIEQDSVVRVDASFADHPERQTGDLEVGDLTMAGGGVVGAAIFGPSPAGGNDLLIARGAVTLNNARLSSGFNYPPREGDVVMLLKKNSAGPISGIFSGYSEGITRKIGDVTVRASYVGGDGNDFTLTVTNTALATSGYRLAEGNGNQTVEPDECNLLFLSLVNRRTSSLTITSAVLRAVTDGVILGPIANPRALVTIASATYPAIPAGATRENLTPFQFRTDATLPCGSPVTFELVVGIAGEGEFAILFTPVSGNDCARPTGGCESCFIVSGQFATNTPTLLRALNFVGAPSLCFPPKRCPATNLFTDLAAVPHITHTFTNSTTNELCLTAQLHFGCLGTSTNALGAIAYRGANDIHDPCVAYLGDTGADGTQPFAFRVPPATNFVLLVSARATNVVCPNYTLELFGLPCPPPTLHIAKAAAPGKVLLQWSTASPGFTLQTTNALRTSGPNAFSNVTSAPVVTGGRYTVTNSATQLKQFFRLTK